MGHRALLTIPALSVLLLGFPAPFSAEAAPSPAAPSPAAPSPAAPSPAAPSAANPPKAVVLGVQQCHTECQDRQTDCNDRCDGIIRCVQGCQRMADECSRGCLAKQDEAEKGDGPNSGKAK
jgi:hypothetical protein